jgi:glyceraldehyde 3-phosphate dehydrogenase
MSVKIGINGFGRIGRNVLRAATEMGSDLEIVAVNDLGDTRTFAHLLKHDTAMGTFGPSVEATPDAIVVDGPPSRFLSAPEAGDQPWGDLGAEIVLESTGHYTGRVEGTRAHRPRRRPQGDHLGAAEEPRRSALPGRDASCARRSASTGSR